ncbi:MAG: hypothetical protein KDD77_12500 [Caldilineaceae bacterium]|nr:hypothetical protein [Caldilineaceae bacterium]
MLTLRAARCGHGHRVIKAVRALGFDLADDNEADALAQLMWEIDTAAPALSPISDVASTMQR